MKYLVVLLVVAWSALALAQGTMPDVDPKAAGEALIAGMSAGQWMLVAGAAGMVLVWLLRIFLLPNLKGKALAWTASILVGVAAAGAAIVANPSAWIEALLSGVGAVVVALTSWDVLKGTTIGQKADALAKSRQR